MDFRLHDESKGKITVLGAPHLELEGGKAATGDVLVELPQSEIKGMSFDLKIDVVENGEVIRTLNTSFSGPMF